MNYTNIHDDGIMDEVAIERALRGATTALTRTERLEVIRRGVVEHDMSMADLERLLGVSNHTVRQWIRRTGKTVDGFFGQEYISGPQRRARQKFDGLPGDIQAWHKWKPPVKAA